MNTIKNSPVIRLSQCFVEEVPPSKRERIMAVLQWMWYIIKHPRFAGFLMLLWCFMGILVFTYFDLPTEGQKAMGTWQHIRLLMVIIIPSCLGIRVYFLIENSL